jgi:hypothetical protein
MGRISLQDLRRVADSLDSLHGRTIVDAVMRSDMRQLRIELAGGEMVVVAVGTDSLGRPRLEVDVVRRASEHHQLEVGFESA